MLPAWKPRTPHTTAAITVKCEMRDGLRSLLERRRVGEAYSVEPIVWLIQ